MDKEKEFAQWLGALKGCEQCALRAEENRGPTSYTGTIETPLMLVGEGPGGVEDIFGVPLVGPSGQLLDRALWSVGVTRDRIYVTNIVKCRPKGNRTPTFMEGNFCAERQLCKEIALIKPAVIVTLGKVALSFFKQEVSSIMKERGQWFNWEGIPVMPTYHPAFLLRKVGKDLVDAKWQVYYDLKTAVEKAKEANPNYQFASGEIINLLEYYGPLKKERQL